MSITISASQMVITLPTWAWAIIGVLFVIGMVNMLRRGGIRH